MELSLWLADFTGGPVVAVSLSATISSVRKNELVLTLVDWFLLIDSDEVVIVAEFIDGWEVSILLSQDRPGGIRVSDVESGKLILEHMSEDSSGQLAHHGCPFLTQFDHSKHVDPPLVDSAVYVGAVFMHDNVLVNQILTGGAVDHYN